MTQYTIRYFNTSAKAWSIYHITHDMSDAYKVHATLLNEGYKASITSQHVNEGDTF